MQGGDPAGLRDRLADRLVGNGAIGSADVEAAFRAVPRHLFVPGVEPATAYVDEAIVTRRDAEGRPTSSSSQPSIMALMLGQLGIQPGHRVLEVGAGTGYNAALLAHLTGPGGAVVTMDLEPDVVREAREHLEKAGCPQVRVVQGDGALGWPDDAPYDRVIVTVGAWGLAPSWSEQLTQGGRLVLPLTLRVLQRSVAFDRTGDHLTSVSVVDCGFMPMRGALAGPEPDRLLNGRPGVFLQLGDGRLVDTAALSTALVQPGRVLPTGVRVSGSDVMGGMGLWVVLHERDGGLLTELSHSAPKKMVPAVAEFPGMAMTVVLTAERSLAALVRLGDVPGNAGADFELGVKAFGPEGEAPLARLAAAVRDWDVHGRLSSRGLTIVAYPPGTAPRVPASAVIDKPHTRLMLTWS